MRGLVIATVLAVTRIAVAEPAGAGAAEPGTTEASAAFQRGRELAKLGRFAEACVEFGRSYELDPALGTAVNLADCLERQGELPRAWLLFDRVARDAQGVQSRARLARERADALLARLATVIVRLREPAAPGLAVRIGDHQVTPAAAIRDLVEPRDVEVVATVPGRPAFRAVLHAVAGATVTVEIPALSAPPGDAAATRRRRPFVYLAGGLGAAGVIGLGASIGFGLQARGIYRAALDHECLATRITDDAGYRACQTQVDRAGTAADRATALAIAGAVLAAAAAAVFLAAPEETIQIAPVATARELGLGVVGRF
ncbi:MAG TPA: hypothetical protein VK601_10430 [Kofleriaceae bacterium]|nr:hypothetical protein [Kofleriaceae bacterium]